MSNNYCEKCGKYSYGNKLCYNCYQMKNKEKSEYDLSSYDKYNSKKYKCKNGILVRSKSEMIISNFLSEKKIIHYYEKELPFTIYDEFGNSREVKLRPDFYIPELKIKNKTIKDVYIEHWGIENNEQYKWRKVYKLMIYEQAKYTLICTTEEDLYDPYKSLNEKLNKIKNKTIV